MKAPLCICNGVIRSGSTWSFNVCRGLMQELGRQQQRPFASTYFEKDRLDGFIANHWENAPGPTVVKAHLIGPTAVTAIRAGQAKAVCTFRDPRDCVASDLVFFAKGIQASVHRVAMTLEYLRLRQITDHILLVRYEHMMSDRRREILRIAKHLNIVIDEDALNHVDSQTNIQATRSFCEQLKHRPANSVLHIAAHRVDPATHLHENHISNAMVGRWRNELPAEQGRWLTEFFGPWLLNLGYETQDSLQAIVSQTAVSSLERHELHSVKECPVLV